jgi:hypothetical protein
MDYVEKSFESATETSKLLITLSTALVAFCAAVVNVKAVDVTLFTPITLFQKGILALSWLLLLVAVGVGVWTQLAITDVLANAKPGKAPSAWERAITFPFKTQIISFVLGVIGLTLYAVLRLFG